MNYELITVIVTIVGTGAGVAGFIIGFISPRLSKIDDDIIGLKERMNHLEINLKERMARLEGLFEGFTGRAQ